MREGKKREGGTAHSTTERTKVLDHTQVGSPRSIVRSIVSVPPGQDARGYGAKEQKKRDGNHAVVVGRSVKVAAGVGSCRRSRNDCKLDRFSGSM